MWKRLGEFVIKQRVILLCILFASSAVMAFFASKVSLSYEFTRAIPTDNPRYKSYLAFKEKFGDDGNVVVVGVQTDKLFTTAVFKEYSNLLLQLKNIPNVEDVLGVPSSITLKKNLLTEKLVAARIFPDSIDTQTTLDSCKLVLANLPFYKSLLYNPEAHAYLMAVRINKDTINSPRRTQIVEAINRAVTNFENKTNIATHLSGLPLIRTVVGDRIQKEMRYFLIGFILFSALILFLFFRSISTTILSVMVVILGVLWSLGVLFLLGYKITLLTALVAPLVVVIGVPNCIYFINKYHTAYLKGISDLPGPGSNPLKVSQQDTSTPIGALRTSALVEMVSKMGIVTLFCNITAAIGFAVFALTRSAILKEFGMVAGISIMMIFVISFILLPGVLSFLPPPNATQTKYLKNQLVTSFLFRIEGWVLHNKPTVYITTVVVLVFSIAGIFKLKTIGYIVDDLPKTDKVYTDLKFFENNFKGIMPLEIVVDTKKRNGLNGMRALGVYEKVDSLAQYIAVQKEMNRPMSIAEGLKFAKQAFYEGDTVNYALPNSFDGAFVGEYLRPDKSDSTKKNNFAKMLSSFIDSSRQNTRISISMADVGTEKLPGILAGIEKRASEIFDTAQYKVQLTGTSITFLEGSRFIISGLKESIFWAFLLIALCMLYLFRSVRILVCSLIPNLIPLVITAGVMGWVGVPLKPSTVLVFSIALGIAIDITIRFLVNYKQELPLYNHNVIQTVNATIKHTGLSIVYTSLVLVAGFSIFCFSDFGGTRALGWLTSVTLLTATLTNLILLPVLLLLTAGGKKAASIL
jgi:predicted RND superfamily exporter protein